MTTLINGALPTPRQLRFVNNQGQPPSKRRRVNAANGHVCLGYSDLVEKKKESTHDSARDSREDTDGDEFLERDFSDPDEDDEKRHSKSKHGAKQYTLGQGEAPRRDSGGSSTVTTASNARPRTATNDWDQAQHARRPTYPRSVSFSEDGRSSNNRSPLQTHHTERHRVPYFRYFGPTAIVPGYKQMVVNISVRDRRRSRGGSFSGQSPASLTSDQRSVFASAVQAEPLFEAVEDLPVYDLNDHAPVHQLILNLVKTFFLHLGCNYPFLREEKFIRMVKEKRVEPILVDAMCALAARFSDLSIFTDGNDSSIPRSEYGNVFAQRARAATVDTFPCPTVGAVQACLLMAYEGFGANQDSALWMYLGLAIRMAVDLGLQKMVGVMYQGQRDPWYTRAWNRTNTDDELTDQKQGTDDETLSAEEQHEVEQERIDTFWAVFILDRVISSGTGRPVTFRDDDFELTLPEAALDPASGLPAPFPTFIQIIHLYGRASDVLNNIRNARDLTQDKMKKLAQMEHELTKLYQKQDPHLHFNASNFQDYVKAGQGTTFILLHFWFHALIIILHQPTLLTPFESLSRTHQLLPNSRELSMSSAKTIADILAFAELIDPKSFIGNPFTSQPMYIAACAFLMESVANASQPASREVTPPAENKKEYTQSANIKTSHGGPSSKHSLLASAANQNYQRCYKSLQQLNTYWGGVGYILTALDQKSKGIWDCETYTNEEYESAKVPRRNSLKPFPRFENPASPNVPPIAWSLTGTTNSPNSSLTLLYQNNASAMASHGIPTAQQPQHSGPTSAATPPGNMVYDPIRQSLPETSMFPPAIPQAHLSAVRHSAQQAKAPRAQPRMSTGSSRNFPRFDSHATDTAGSASPDSGRGLRSSSSMHAQQHPPLPTAAFTAASHHPSSYETGGLPAGSPTSALNDTSDPRHSHNTQNVTDNLSGGGNSFSPDFAQSGLASGSYAYYGPVPITDVITFDSQEIELGMLDLPNEMMPAWFDYLPGDVLNMFESGMNGGGNHQHHQHMG
ncbi:uncharacterized protein E0L32_009656 [Thyridium curvatum]|uniref:Xylanolytic transcriptional activator regulatory domain-containing protein n=1 Tax=Thyridium curvatum TaxID=1093900 RepID=A0A507AVG6_9PEZI|nr:uncharacterized protein E0L32_009656 [Thyridium curvatum]TPX08838.1 hypothetical protein E0L32_009656 [Thyridium curvatum]